jgi:serine/threonine protein kinase
MNLGERQANAVFIEEFLDEIGFADSARECFDADKKFMRSINIIKKLGTGAFGSVYLVCKPNMFHMCQVTFALKIIGPASALTEVFAMKLFYDDVMSNMFPNLPIMYGYRMCNDCTFPSGSLLIPKKSGERFLGVGADLGISEEPIIFEVPPKYKNTHRLYAGEQIECSVLMTEYAFYGALEYVLEDIDNNANVAKSMFFQLLASIYFIQSNYGMEHNDIHHGNILVHKVDAGGVWEYVINGVQYYFSNEGYLPVLWDFGLATYPSKNGHKDFMVDYINPWGFMLRRDHGNDDVRRLIKAFQRSKFRVHETERVKFLVNRGMYDVSEMIADACSFYTTKPVMHPVIDTFFTSELQPVEWYASLPVRDLERMNSKLTPFMKDGFSIHRKWGASCISMFKDNLMNFRLLACVIDNENAIRQLVDWFDLRYLSRSRHVPHDLIIDNASEFDWTALSYFNDLSADICDQFKTLIVWEYITDDKIRNWSVDALIHLANYLRWDKLVLANRSAEEISQLQTYVDWKMISTYYPITSQFAAMFRHHLVPELVSVNKQADHDAVFKVAPELVRWDMVSPVTIAQLRVHATDVDWTVVSQAIDVKHVDEFVPYIHWESFWSRNDITPEIISQYKEYLVAHTLVGPLSSALTETYDKYINWDEYNCSLMGDDDLYRNRARIHWEKKYNCARLDDASYDMIDKIVKSKKFNWDVVYNAGASVDILIRGKDKFSRKDLTNYAGFQIFDYIRFDDIDWTNVSRFPDLPKEHVRALHRVLDLSLLSYKDFDWEFIRKHEDEVNWSTISKLPDLPETFMQVYFDRLV